MNHLTHAKSALVLLVLLTPALAACRWSVPADPGLNHQLRARPAATEITAAAPAAPQAAGVAQDARARTLYFNHCGRCHEPFEPASVAAADWPFYVQKYGPRAALFGADRARVLAWLQANAP